MIPFACFALCLFCTVERRLGELLLFCNLSARADSKERPALREFALRRMRRAPVGVFVLGRGCFCIEVEMKGSAFAGDGRSIAIGCGLGFVGGLGLGFCIAVLLGGFTEETAAIVVLHTTLAMTIMGGWTAPSLMPESSPSDELAANAAEVPSAE
jgi:hypothetical protein